MESESPRATSKVEMSKVAIAINLVVHLILFGVAGVITLKSFEQGPSLFSWHPTFLVLGYLILMSHAILSMADNNFYTSSLSYQNKVTIHWILQATAGVFIMIGVSCIYANKMMHDKPHFQSTHAIFGLITNILLLTSIAGGVVTKYSFQLRKSIKPLLIKMGHSAFGMITYVMSIISIVLGIYSGWGGTKFSTNGQSILMSLLITTTCYVLSKSIILLFNRAQRSLKQSNL